MISGDEKKRGDSFRGETVPCGGERRSVPLDHMQHPHPSPVHEEVRREEANFPASSRYEDYIPVVDKAVDSSWRRSLSDEKFSLSHGDLSKAPAESLSGLIISRVMTFVVGVFAVLRLASGAPEKKKTHAALLWFAGAASRAPSPVKAHPLRRHIPRATLIPPAEHSAVIKRLGDLEEKVAALSAKPAQMPREKEQLLVAAVSRAEALEADLQATKKALEDALARQDELHALIDKKAKKKKKNIRLNPFSW